MSFKKNTTPLSSSFIEKIITLLIFLYWMTYENIIFFYSNQIGGTLLSVLTTIIKLLLPFGLLFYTGLPSLSIIKRGYSSIYLLFFTLFLLWGSVPTMIYQDIFSWLKLIPRYVFFISALSFFLQKPSAFLFFSKCVICYVLFSLVQYILLYATETYLADPGQYVTGPFGLLGNVQATRFYPDLPPIIRLTGFWNEPSNASASAYAAFFLSRHLAIQEQKKIWKNISWICLIIGILTLSNAGYLSIGTALIFPVFFGVKKWTFKKVKQLLILMPLAIFLLIIGMFGRRYVLEHYSDISLAQAVVGVSGKANPETYDPLDGRLDLFKTAITTVKENYFGIGIKDGSDSVTNFSSSAPVIWLFMTGIPGLTFLLMRELTLLLAACELMKKNSQYNSLVQALIVVMVQHTSYGSWMNPNYFIPAIMVFIYINNLKAPQHPKQLFSK